MGIPHILVPFKIGNSIYGETYGLEIHGQMDFDGQVASRRLYSFLQIQLHRERDFVGYHVETPEGESPHHQFNLHSSINLPREIVWSWFLRYVDSLPAMSIGSYFEFDTTLTWRPVPFLELSVVGRNLISNRHAEFMPSFASTQSTEVQRSIYGRVILRF